MSPKFALALSLIAVTSTIPANAQQAGASADTVVASEPGSAAVMRTMEISAQVVSVDKAARKVSLKGPQGNLFDIIAGDEVRNFDQIKPGQVVVARYVQAIALELLPLRGAKTDIGDVAVHEDTARAEKGQQPAAGKAYEISAIAEVVDVDPGKNTITLKGPLGNVVPLAVRNPEQFKVVKKGDQVSVTYTEAIALSVEPAPNPASTPKN